MLSGPPLSVQGTLFPFSAGGREDTPSAADAASVYLGPIRAREEGQDALVHAPEPRLRGDVAATFEEFG